LKPLNPNIDSRSRRPLDQAPAHLRLIRSDEEIDPGPLNLTSGQLQSLRELDRRTKGAEIQLNIGDAQSLTALGLAERTQSGWKLTLAGGQYLPARRR